MKALLRRRTIERAVAQCATQRLGFSTYSASSISPPSCRLRTLTPPPPCHPPFFALIRTTTRHFSHSLPCPSPPPDGKDAKDGDDASSTNRGKQTVSKRKGPAKNSLRSVAAMAQAPNRREFPKRTVVSPAARPPVEDAAAVEDRSATAVCVALSMNMPKVVDILSGHGFDIDPDGTGFEPSEVVHARGANGGDIFVFPSGNIVTWSVPLDVIIRQLQHAMEGPYGAAKYEYEDLDYVEDTARDTSGLKNDLIVLGTRREAQDGDRLETTFAKIAFSSGLARSTTLAILETALAAYFESTRHIPAILSQGASFSLRRGFILQKTGELLSLRARLNHYSELTDSLPDILWDSKADLKLEGYYEQVGRALDVRVRIELLNRKMDYAQEIASILRQMSSEKHSTRLEIIIIVLIAVEVILELKMPQTLFSW